MRLSRLVVVVAGLGVAGGLFTNPNAASAAVVAGYEVTASGSIVAASGPTPAHIDTTDGDVNSTASYLSAGPGMSLAFTSQFNGAVSGGGLFVEAGGTGVTGIEAGAVTAGDYLTFTLTPSVGYAVDLTSLQFSLGARKSATAGNYTAYAFLRTSVDGYAANVDGATASFTNVAPSASGTAAGATQTISLTSIPDQSGPVTFRVYFYRTGPASERIYFDSFALNGTTSELPAAVPEPATLGLLAAAGGLLLGRRRR